MRLPFMPSRDDPSEPWTSTNGSVIRSLEGSVRGLPRRPAVCATR